MLIGWFSLTLSSASKTSAHMWACVYRFPWKKEWWCERIDEKENILQPERLQINVCSQIRLEDGDGDVAGRLIFVFLFFLKILFKHLSSDMSDMGHQGHILFIQFACAILIPHSCHSCFLFTWTHSDASKCTVYFPLCENSCFSSVKSDRIGQRRRILLTGLDSIC